MSGSGSAAQRDTRALFVDERAGVGDAKHRPTMCALGERSRGREVQTDPIRVLYLIETLGIGGAEQSLLQILPRLRGVDPVMCHLYEGDDLKAAYEAAGIPVVSLNLPERHVFRTAIPRVAALARRENAALIHTTLFTAEVVGRAVGKWLRRPVISSLVSECYADVRWQTLGPIGRLKLAGVQLLDELTAPWAWHFIANSGAVKASGARSLRVPPDKISVIYRGRNPSHFAGALSAAEERDYRSALGAERGPILLNVARLVDSKGHAEMIEAFAQIVQVLPDATLLIAGDGPEKDRLEQQVHVRGLTERVRLLGRRDDIPALLAVASVFIFPSHYEGHPGALVEAMLAAKPIIASDIPVHRETIADGRTGVLVPLRSANSIAAAVLSMLGDASAAAAMGERARHDASERFNTARAAEQYGALYRRVLADYQHRAGDRRARHAPPNSRPAGCDGSG